METSKCLKFRMQLDALIQSSGLNVGTVYYIIRDCMYDLERIYMTQATAELNEAEQKKNQEQETTTE